MPAELFDVYQDTYLAVREQHAHPGEPVLYNSWVYCETLPPPGWDRARYAAYFGEVTRLTQWYLATRKYAAKRRKTVGDRIGYEAMCDQYGVAGHGLRFAGEPAQGALL